MQDIKDYLSYDPLTGEFTWIKAPANRIKIGAIAGTKNNRGYWVLRLKNIRFAAHRLAWYFSYGEIPEYNIDHINNNKTDNRKCNLRLATQSQNMQNTSKPRTDNTSGYQGVSWHKDANKWSSRIKVRGKQIFLGYYDTPEGAHAAYLCAKREYHPFWIENK